LDSLRETSVWLAINGTRRIMLTCSPHEREALALGHLLSEGWIDEAGDVLALAAVDGPCGATGVDMTLDVTRERAALQLRDHRLQHGCGLRHEIDCVRPAVATEVMPAMDAAVLFRALFAAADKA
jgi:formate dehydrogenase accessory protein FdhD